jgi:hypothetical protein
MTSSLNLAGWTRKPPEQGWYWHRFYVDAIPIYNLCCAAIVNERVFIQYVGERDTQVLQADDKDMFWGPLIPPP